MGTRSSLYKAVFSFHEDDGSVRSEVVSQAVRCSRRGCGISGVEDMTAQHHQL